jgi:predicted dehydrogenase
MKVAIIGCGLIGKKRAQSLPAEQVAWFIDKRIEAAKELAKTHPSAQVDTDWKKAFSDPAVGLVIIATAHRDLAPLTKAAVESGKHVLVEKPAGVTAAELKPIVELARAQKKIVKVGFNHRYHPSFLKAREIVDSGALGKVMFIRAKYGHGARVGYEKEWRAQKELSGGGELIDQGMHLIDLSRWFMGEFTKVSGYAPTLFWKMDVEDNCFLDLRTSSGQIAWLHAGWTEWKNVFCFEIMAQHGKLQIDGLGGSYGTESLTYYKMLPQMGPPETTTWEYPFPDKSWELEMKDLLQAIQTGREPMGNISDGYEALRIVDKIYSEETK